MILLNDLKDFYLYNNKIISGISKENNNSKKDIAIINLSNSIDNLIGLNSLLYKSNFRSFYIPYKFHTLKNKIVTLSQKEIYDEVKNKVPSLTMMKKDLDMYNDLNLIYDLSYETKTVMLDIKVKGLNFIKKYLYFLENRYSSVQYKEKIISVSVPENYKLAGKTVNNNENPFIMLYLAMTKGYMPEGLEGSTFLFYTQNGYFVKFKYNKNIKKTDLMKAFNKISKAHSGEIIEDESPEEVVANKETNNIIYKDKTMDNIKKIYLNKIGVKTDGKIGDVLQSNIDDLNNLIDNKIGKLDVDFNKLTGEDLVKMIMTDKEIIKQSKIVSDLAIKGKITDRYVEQLKEKQNEVVFNGNTLSDIMNKVQNLAIDDKELKNDVITNNEVKHNKILDFDESYQRKQMTRDMVNIITAFNEDEDIKLFVKNIKAENTSDMFTKKMTYEIQFQDETRNIHNFKINYPILKDGKYMIVGGGRKLILKQLFLLPIIKTKPDTVQITTNYNKLFIYRFGDKLSDGTESIKKLLSQKLDDYIERGSRFNYKKGNVQDKNKRYNTSLEYDELSKNFSFIENKDYLVSFDQTKFNKDIKKFKQGIFQIGYNKNNKDEIFADDKTGVVYTKTGSVLSENLSLFIIDNILKTSLVEDKMKEFYSFNQTKTLAYNRCRITGRTIPIIILLAYEKGLKDILDRYNLKYEFIKSNRVPKQFGLKRVKFQDGYLTYSSLDLKATLLLEGLTLIDTENYTFNQMDTKEPYIEYFADVHGSRNIGKGLHNMLSLMVDPITKEILEDLELPTNIIDMILYSNTLLASSDYKAMNDMSCYRLRGAEQVNAVLYKILADTFKTYKDTSNNGNPIKISVDPDILIKQLNALKTVDEYSILNPSLEIDKGASVTYKGPSGKLCPLS